MIAHFVKKIINTKPIEVFIGRNDVLAIVESETVVRNLDINFELLKTSSVRGLIVSAKGESCDFVSRFFAPSAGVYESRSNCLLQGLEGLPITTRWSQWPSSDVGRFNGIVIGHLI